LRPVYFSGEEYAQGRLDDWERQYALLAYPGVYVWYRREARLVLKGGGYVTRRDEFVRYVGRTDNCCWERILTGRPHEHIRPHTVLPTDRFAFYPCRCWNEVLVLEIDLIELFKPPAGCRRDRIGLYNYLIEAVGPWEPKPDSAQKEKKRRRPLRIGVKLATLRLRQ
jgi:hypothetical protein